MCMLQLSFKSPSIMAVQRTDIWLKVMITVLGLLAAAVTLYATIKASPDALEEDRRRSLNKLLRYERAAEDDCLWALTAKGSGSTLKSPNYPENYPSNAECHWLITADDPNATVSLKIDVLSIEPDKDCRLDYLQVYLGGTPLAPKLGPFCGNIHNKVIETNVSRILLEFRSDMMYEDKGFSIDYFTQTAGDCQAKMTDGSGSLRSPGFPDNYPDDTDCSTLISVKEDKKIILNFDSVDLEFGDNCTFDYVQIFDGTTKDSTLLGQICQETNVRSFESSSSSLLVHFHSDDSVNKKGYRARYSSVDKRNSPVGNCQWEASESNGTISSPNYPENYPSSSNCSIWILAPEGSTVSITIEAVLLEMDYNCSFDFLLISEGPSSDSTTLGRFCGMRSEPKQINSTQHEVRIQFQSDDFVEFSGFKLQYHYVKEESANNEAIENPTVAPNGTFKFSTAPENVTLSEGSSSVLQCSTKHPTARIRWLKGDKFLTGDIPLPGLRYLANNSLWIQSMNSRLVGVYTCVAISLEGELAATAYVFMADQPSDVPCEVDFRKIPSDSEFEEDGFAHLECLVVGENIVLSWEKDGEPLQMENHITVVANGYIFMEEIRLQDAGVYTCVARNTENGCVKRASAVLKVIEKIRIEEICGRSKARYSLKKKSQREKIIGGYDAPKGAYPWQVMLWEPTRKSFCGATLLNERWIVTAAHCFRNEHKIPWDSIRILLGKHDREHEEEEVFSTSISGQSSIVLHPGFNRFTYDNDLALVRMSDLIHFTDYILPVCLGTRNTSEYLLSEIGDPDKPRMGTVIGWGKLKENGGTPRYLQEIKLPVVEQRLCKTSTNFTVTRNMFCAGYAQEIIGDACYGDSGGPFLMPHEGRWYIVGIVSWGEGCGKQNKYGFYTRIANHLSWINSVINS